MHLDKTVVKLKIKEFSPEREKLLYLIIVVYIVKFFFYHNVLITIGSFIGTIKNDILLTSMKCKKKLKNNVIQVI